MDILRGSSALSGYKVEKLLEAVAKTGIEVASICTRFIHLVDVDAPLSDDKKVVLNKILTYGPVDEEHSEAGDLFFVIPRIGTISPWASKATDIAHNCGLTEIHRIERGIAYWFKKKDGTSLNADERKAIIPLIHDRMMQTVLDSFDAGAALFEKQSPKPFTTVPLTTGGKEALKKAKESR